MRIFPIETGYFKLDGGAIFGTVPKVIWQKNNSADNENLIDLVSRCMLIEDKKRLILVDAGMGDKQSDKFFSYYKPHGNDTLEKSILKLGFSLDDITDVVFTHLHFDHCGGATKWDNKKEKIIPTFKNAKYWCNEDHWKWATEPNPREKPSFLKENINPIKETGQLNFVNFKGNKFISKNENKLNIDLFRVDGHTDAQMLPKVKYKGREVVFMADLLPLVGHIPINYTIGYDTRPLISMDEKKTFLEEALKNDYLLMMQHDPKNILIDLERTEKGIRMKNSYTWDEIF